MAYGLKACSCHPLKLCRGAKLVCAILYCNTEKNIAARGTANREISWDTHDTDGVVLL